MTWITGFSINIFGRPEEKEKKKKVPDSHISQRPEAKKKKKKKSMENPLFGQ